MGKRILIIGAGRSTHFLIDFLCKKGLEMQWEITITDIDYLLAQKRAIYANSKAKRLNVVDLELVSYYINKHDLVISMLPANMHFEIAKICLELGKHFLTASYLSNDIKSLDQEVKDKKLIFLNEIGLDPGLDHLSAMKIIDQIREDGGHITEFESFAGGLISKINNYNPWQYKFTWNPRNVVLAGQGGAVKFIQEHQIKYIPPNKIFRRTEIIEIEAYGKFEGYANRDSLKYIDIYKLNDIKTMYRGTLRRPGFCKAWNIFVELGATDDSYNMNNSESMTHRDFINTFLPYHPYDSVEIKLKHYLKIDQDDNELWEKLVWLDIFEKIPLGVKNLTPAAALQLILSKKWDMVDGEKDMIVMWNKFVFEKEGLFKTVESSLVVEGTDNDKTAMSKTVGLPLAIAATLILNNKIDEYGCILPLSKQIYMPILDELETLGIQFQIKKH